MNKLSPKKQVEEKKNEAKTLARKLKLLQVEILKEKIN